MSEKPSAERKQSLLNKLHTIAPVYMTRLFFTQRGFAVSTGRSQTSKQNLVLLTNSTSLTAGCRTPERIGMFGAISAT